jgi:hypothetical protein
MTCKISPKNKDGIARILVFRHFVFLLVAMLFLCGMAMAQTTTTLLETAYVTTAGNASSQPVATSINLLDESGTQSTFTKYVEFNTNLNAVYAGYQLYTLPTSISPSSVTGIQVKVNYRGPATATQTWTWQLFNWAINNYATVGDNTGTPSWGAWQILTFNAGGTLANYVRSSDGQIKVQLLSNNASDAADIDYEAVLVTYSSGPPALAISTTSLPNGTVGTAYSATLAATGGTTPYSWSITAGSLPAGVTLNASTGALSGTPTASGTFSPTFQVTDSSTPTHQTASKSFTFTVAAASALSITTTSPLPSGTVGTAYSTTFAATGGVTPYAWSITSGSVPGLALSSAGVLSGTPTTASTYTITVQVTDSTAPTAQTATANLSITVNAASSGGSHYVSTTGNDNNAGTLTSPWRTIQHAVNTVTIAGDTIYVRGGVYGERVSMSHSGNATGGPITLQSYPGELAIVDGTGIAVGTGGYAYGLVDINGQSYVTVSALEIRNFSGSGGGLVPAGVHVEGSGSNIQILNNHIHDIVIQGNSCNTTNGFGLIAVGTNGTAPMTNLTVSGNELDHMVTGCSETMTVNGNVQNFTIANNKVHDNNNIGIAALGGEGVASGYSRYNGSPNDQARNGTISGNTVYNITSNNNPVYKGACNCADGIYLDGSAYVVVERNVVHNADINEVAGEGSGQNTDHNIVRNNLFYSNGVAGLSIGGQTKVGSASNVTVVNNTFYNNGTYGSNVSLGEFTTGINLTGVNIFENNIAYAGPTGVLVKAVTTTSLTLDYNVYYSTASPSWIWSSPTYTSFASYQSATAQDAHSLYANPQFLSITTTPPNLDISSTSPANDVGINLGSSVVGAVDFAGNARVQGARIEIGAYEH